GLVGVKRKAAHGSGFLSAALPRFLGSTPPGRREGVSGILHEPETLSGTKLLQLCDVHHESTNVDGYQANDRHVLGYCLRQTSRSELSQFQRRIHQIKI